MVFNKITPTLKGENLEQLLSAIIEVPLVPEIDNIYEILTWIDFQNILKILSNIADVFTLYDDILDLTVKAITNLSNKFDVETATNDCINSIIRCTEAKIYCAFDIIFQNFITAPIDSWIKRSTVSS